MACAVAAGGLIGAFAVPILAARGGRQLSDSYLLTGWQRAVVSIAGSAAAGAVAALPVRAGSWAFVPAFLTWGCALAALAACDAVARRVPTPLVRQSTALVLLLLVIGAAVTGDWRSAVVSAMTALAAAFALLVAWRLLGAGFGDVRLALLGGLGLGRATMGGLLMGLGVWAAVLAVQTVASHIRGGSLGAEIALGPGLVAGFLVAATASP